MAQFAESGHDAVVKSEGMYMGVLDRQSGANTPGAFGRLLHEAQTRAGKESWATIPHLNDLLSEHADQGALLSWVLIFDGVFRVRVEVVGDCFKESDALLSPTQFAGRARSETYLACPSGEIVVESLHRLGTPLIRAMVTVSPGRYRVWLHGDNRQQIKHEFLEDVASYPEADGPDWVLYLQEG